jgi:hypothetical protein
MEDKWFERVLIVAAIIGVAVLLFASRADAAGTVCQIGNGCTGTSTAPGYGKVLIGDSHGNYELTATSSLGFPAGGSGTVTSVTASTPNSTLNLGGTNPVTTSGTISFDLNLANPNWWTGRQNFTTATTSNFEATSTDVFLDGYASTILTVNATHQVTAYGGATDPCSANQAPTTLSALGVLGGCTSTFLTSAVTSVSGTTNQITSSGGNTPTLSLPNLVLIPLDASSTELSVFTESYFGSSATTTIDSAGNIVGATNAKITFTNASTTNSSVSGNAAFNGNITACESSPATSTAIVLNWPSTCPQVRYLIGTSATTITLINASTTPQAGSRKLVIVCNPPAASGGALTWAGVEWIGSAPTQTTTAGQCDFYSFDVTEATSTSAYKVAGTQGAGFQ